MEIGETYTVIFDDLGRPQRKVYIFKGTKDGLAKFVNIRGKKVEYIPVTRIIRVEEVGTDEQAFL